VVNCAILSSNPWVGKWDCQIKSWRGKSWDEVLKSLSGNLWDEDPKSLNKKMDLNFKSLNRKIWHEDLKCLIYFFSAKERFHSSAFTTQKNFHPNSMDNSWKKIRVIFFLPTRKNIGRNHIFPWKRKIICDQIWSKTCIWSNLIKSILGGGEKNQ